ncbi:hypothetical protein EV644_1021 [Kribbella orskensis]|uniref:Uncharacterized protein n=1 Tax=Kribbella orskensis TaxID=2512216 RepID=A0ABY2BRH5_9ACTN|nr:hypothetical protein EV642_102736 [Kribbella sp. VKM Ac-2500]TCO29285.1 hypothetical protein EV644_1021 [Kribbella orskensis]
MFVRNCANTPDTDELSTTGRQLWTWRGDGTNECRSRTYDPDVRHTRKRGGQGGKEARRGPLATRTDGAAGSPRQQGSRAQAHECRRRSGSEVEMSCGRVIGARESPCLTPWAARKASSTGQPERASSTGQPERASGGSVPRTARIQASMKLQMQVEPHTDDRDPPLGHPQRRVTSGAGGAGAEGVSLRDGRLVCEHPSGRAPAVVSGDAGAAWEQVPPRR